MATTIMMNGILETLRPALEAGATTNVAKDGNSVVRIYHRDFAKEFASRHPIHAELLAAWLAALRAREAQ
jgi:hypothetical protein